MRQPTRPEASPSRAPGLKIERDPPFPKIFSSAFETVPMEAGKTGRGVDLQACVPRAFQKPILRGLLSAPRVYSAWAKRPSPCLTATGTMARRGSRRSRVHLDARSCKAAWRRSCCPQRFHGPRLRGSLGSRQSWDLNRSPQAHYPTRLRGFGKPSILRLMGRGSPAAPGPQNRKIEKAPSAISPSILPKPTPVPWGGPHENHALS